MEFKPLGLSEELLAAVADAGYSEPTPIQRQAIPAALMGRDVLGIAQTGTGKTAGFTLPMIDILAAGRAKARMPRSLILEPTRELAAQVSDSFETYGKNHKLSMALLIGGVSFADQEAKLDRGVDVLIATPGRLLDHFERGKLMLTGVKILVVDESDRMLDMGFIPDVERICGLMPQDHQTLFFSATMPPPVKRLTDQFLRDPKVIEVARPATTAETVAQFVVTVSPRDKPKALRALIDRDEVRNAIVFCNRKRDVKAVYTSLKRNGYDAVQLHGDMAQPDRMDVLQRFRDNDVRLLIASDVAARGLDIPTVGHVFNYDVPEQADDYVHRVGRTGRAGREGIAVTIATPEEARYVRAIEKLTGKTLEVQSPDGVRTQELAAEGEDEPKGRRSRRRPKDARAKEERPKDERPRDERPRDERKDRDRPARKNDRRDDRRDERKDRDKPARKPRSSGRRSERDEPVVGLGDHVPDFLKRPVPGKRSD